MSAARKSVSFYSEDVRLVGDAYYPADIAPGTHRARIVLCHGCTGVKDLYLPDNAHVLNEAGYVVLTFVITSDGDRLVPPGESIALHARAGEPKRLIVLRGHGHYEAYQEPAFGEIMHETIDWYRRHLPALPARRTR